MKILSITAQKPHSTGSGVYLTQLVRAWNSQGHTQAVVAGLTKQDTVIFPRGVMVYPVYFDTPALPFPIVGMSDEMPYPSTRYRELTPERTQQFCAAFRRMVTRAVEDFAPDLIVCHHLYLLTALVRGWFPKQKVVGLCHGSDLRQFGKNPLGRHLIRENIPRLDRIFALHERQKEEICGIFSCSAEQVHAVGAGYDQTIFYPGQSCGDRTEKHLIFAGKVTEKKGVFSLLRALERLPYPRESLRVSLVGGPGPDEEYREIQAMARRGKYPVDLTGPLPQTRLAELLRQSDVFVLPSFFEGLALVNLEALACGCRVVCTDLPGIAGWFDANVPGHGISFVAPPSMKNVDEPDPASLPAFEERLAQAICKELETKNIQAPELSHISWQGVSQKILELS